jgi:tetratricopeptide (TPR) repeat protein
MAYNKSKSVEAAQKLLNQGKVPQAISEYQQILKFEPRDQVTLMTVGELYIRQGETFQAIEYFERLAQIFVGDGFLTKAIAVYKRIAKLAPEEIRPLEKLADLYVQQGVMSEARPLFLQLAEIHLKNNRQPEAVGLLKKLLLAEPDNLRIQVRLADLYQAMGQSREALDTYIAAAQRAIARGDHAECEKLADKALKIEPHNLDALTVKARSASAQGNTAAAAGFLEQVPDLEKGGEQTELLLDLYLKSAKWEPATALAMRVFEADEKNFGPMQKLIEALLESGQTEKAMAILEKSRIPMIDAGEHEIVGRLLNDLAARMPGRIEPLEWLVDSYGRTSDSFRLPDALANLGDAMVAAKQYDRAKEVLERLVDREPESESAKRKLNDLLRKMGLLAPDTSAPPPPEVHELELPKAPAPKVRPDLPVEKPAARVKSSAPVEAPLDDETQKFIAQSLTDVDLFASYGLTQKAIGLLEAILRRAPRHTPTLEKLLDFVLGAGDDRRTAELASHLEQIHKERGDTRSAERFGELRRRFQRAAGLTDDELSAAPAAVSVPAASIDEPEGLPELEIAADVAPEVTPRVTPQAPAPVAVSAEEISASQPAPAQELHEVDLSDEWASLLGSESAAPSPSASAAPTQSPAETSPSASAEFAVSDELSSALEEFSIEEEPPAPAAAIPATPSEVAPLRPQQPGADAAEFDIPELSVSESAAHNDFADISAEIPPASDEELSPPKLAHVEEESTSAIELSLDDIFAEALPPLEEPSDSAHPVESAEPPHASASQAVHELSLDPSENFAPPPTAGAEPADPAFDPEQHLADIHAPEHLASEAPLELELDQEYDLVLEPEALVPAYDQRPPETSAPVAPPVVPTVKAEPVPAAANFTADQFLSELASEMNELGLGELSPEFATAAEKPAAPPALKPTANGQGAPGGLDSAPLKEVFDEFRAELGEMGTEDEDLETHYNLGIAFREMGLVEEAISEFQKVAQACERGRPFRYVMQCCTLLGLAFIDKGQPAIAAIWYERALKTPGLEPDSELALRYDLGVAQESAGQHEAALKSFSHVYAMNIDYRDVAERIAALQKSSR